MLSSNISVVILAAGKGKRMNNPNLPKVLAPLRGKTLLYYVLQSAIMIGSESTAVIVGHQKEMVIDYCKSLDIDNIEFAEQKEQLGTGHAVAQAKSIFENYEGNILILCGDVPLLRASTLSNFIREHNKIQSSVSVLTAKASNPFGYGRIIRDYNGNFIKITEEKDADEIQKTVDEINSGVYCIDSKDLFLSLDSISNNNSQGEYYLTDIIEILRNQGKKASGFCIAEFDELQGVNSPEQLANIDLDFDKYISN